MFLAARTGRFLVLLSKPSFKIAQSRRITNALCLMVFVVTHGSHPRYSVGAVIGSCAP